MCIDCVRVTLFKLSSTSNRRRCQRCGCRSPKLFTFGQIAVIRRATFHVVRHQSKCVHLSFGRYFEEASVFSNYYNKFTHITARCIYHPIEHATLSSNVRSWRLTLLLRVHTKCHRNFSIDIIWKKNVHEKADAEVQLSVRQKGSGIIYMYWGEKNVKDRQQQHIHKRRLFEHRINVAQIL